MKNDYYIRKILEEDQWHRNITITGNFMQTMYKLEFYEWHLNKPSLVDYWKDKRKELDNERETLLQKIITTTLIHPKEQ
jgi:hypothetical protein